MDDGADVGGAVAIRHAQGIAVQGVFIRNGLDTCGAGDGFDGLRVIGVFREDGLGTGIADLLGGILDVRGSSILLVIEVRERGSDELHVIVVGEVAEGIVR